MPTEHQCPKCGAGLPAEAPQGLCPRCLLVAALDSAAPGVALPTTRIEPGSETEVGERIDRYKILQKLGEGGYGVVYMAEQTNPVRRRVALKVIKLGMDTKQVIGRFEAERQALALMDHPNIAKVLDAGTTEKGRPYFVMELVKGVRITDYCDQKQLSTAERLGLFTQVCQAIQHAHQKGIIHRDIKPSNILVTVHDGVPVPKVIDFGIAKATEQPLTEKTMFTAFGQFMGTPAYMSPEQAELSGLDIDTRSDIYALGVLLYELLTGRTPFDAKELLKAGLDEMRRRIREEEPMRPSTRLSTMVDADLTEVAHQRQSEPAKLTRFIRGDLDWIVMKCLEKDRTRRYETANGLAMDIQRHLGNEPVTAGPPSKRYTFEKFVRRNRRQVVAVGVLAVVLVLGVLGTTWGLIEAKRQEWQAQKRLIQIEKANDILGSIFENLDPREIAKSERPLQAILVEKLDRAVEQLQGDSIGDPLVVATMQDRVAVSLLGLGQPNKAIVLLENARATRQAKLGLNHTNTLDSMNNLATAYLAAGKIDLALPLFAETLNLRKTNLGWNHRDTLQSMNNLAEAYAEVGKYDLALPLLVEALELVKSKLGLDNPDTLTTMNNLAAVYQLAVCRA